MQHYWNDLINQTFNGRYVLGRFLGEYRGSGVFEVLSGAAAAPAVIHVLRSDSPEAKAQERSWSIATSLAHPNIVRVLDSGLAYFDDAEFVFGVTEKPDDTVADVLPQRPLTEEEVRQVLASVVPALRHLHDHGVVHGALQPGSIVAIGDNVKVTSDSLAPADEAGISSDIRALGMTLAELLTAKRAFILQNGRVEPTVMKALPTRFQAIVAGLVDQNPGKQWGLWQIQRALAAASSANGAAAPEPGIAPSKAVRSAANRRQSSRKLAMGALIAAVVIILIGIIVTLRSSKPEPEQPLAADTSRPSPVPEDRPDGQRARLQIPPPAAQDNKPAQASERPAPPVQSAQPPASPPQRQVTEVPAGNSDGEWSVIAAIYHDYDAAAARARNFQDRLSTPVTVFPAKGEGRRYMVIVGSGLSRTEAERVRERARSAGLPSDTYVSKVAMP